MPTEGRGQTVLFTISSNQNAYKKIGFSKIAIIWGKERFLRSTDPDFSLIKRQALVFILLFLFLFHKWESSTSMLTWISLLFAPPLLLSCPWFAGTDVFLCIRLSFKAVASLVTVLTFPFLVNCKIREGLTHKSNLTVDDITRTSIAYLPRIPPNTTTSVVTICGN